MFFKKSEPKRRHPCLVLTIGALSIIGALTVTNASKCAINNAKNKIKSFFSPKSDSSSDTAGDSAFPARTSLGGED